MKSVFIDKTCSILIVIPGEAVRMKIQQTLRGLGFNNFKACDTIAAARKHLKVHNVDWVLMTLFQTEAETAIQFLYYLQSDRQSSQIYVSLFLNDEEISVTPLAFELGILSSHKSYFESDTLRNIVLKLTDLSSQFNYNPTLVALTYYRSFLIQQRRFETLLQLEQTAVKTHPEQARLLLHLAEAQFLSNKHEAAKTTLSRAHLLEPDLAKDIHKLKLEYLKSSGVAEANEGPNAEKIAYKIKTVVVVDPDEASNMAIRNVLSQFQIDNLHAFSDGQSAWEWIKDHDKIDLVIMEWKLQKLPGPFLIQRIRTLPHGNMPIVVASSLLKESDGPILEEFSVAKTMEKPINSTRLSEALNWVAEQENLPSDRVVLEKKIFEALGSGDLVEASRLKKEFELNPTIPNDRKKYLDACFNYHFGNYGKAKADLQTAVKHSTGDSLAITNLMGKCHLHLGEFRPALQSFQKAQSVSPQNIERLCKIAEVYLYLDELPAAEKTIEQAEQMDASNPHVDIVKTELQALKSNLDVAFGIMGKVSDISSLVAFLNNHAVAKTRAGDRKEGIEMYKSVLKILAPTEKKNIAKVSYNLGLAYVRSQEMGPAAEALKNSLAASKVIALKASSLLTRVEEAIKTGVSHVKINDDRRAMLQDADGEIDFDNYEETLGPTPSSDESGIQLSGSRATEGVLCLRGVFSFRDEFEGLSVSLNRKPEKK